MEKFDILNPKLVCIGSRCYRKFTFGPEIKQRPEEKRPFREERYICEEDDITGPNIFHQGDRFWCVMQQPAELFESIKIALKRLYSNPKPKITKSKEFVEITISANNEDQVHNLYRQVEIILENIRMKKPFTHFVSLPMNFKNIKLSFADFKEKVLQSCRNVEGINSSIFQNPDKLHLTIIPLLMMGPQEQETGVVLLQACKEEIKNILGDKKLVVHVKGIEYMNDDPGAVDVLYAKVQEFDGGECLQKLANLLLEKFINTPFAKNNENFSRDSVKLHITLMNSIFDSRDSVRKTFDAKKILKEYQDWDFGTATLTQVHISVRYTRSENGYYVNTSVLEFA